MKRVFWLLILLIVLLSLLDLSDAVKKKNNKKNSKNKNRSSTKGNKDKNNVKKKIGNDNDKIKNNEKVDDGNIMEIEDDSEFPTRCAYNRFANSEWLGGRCVPCDQCDKTTGYEERCRWYKDDCGHMEGHCCCFPGDATLPSDCKFARGRKNINNVIKVQLGSNDIVTDLVEGKSNNDNDKNSETDNGGKQKSSNFDTSLDCAFRKNKWLGGKCLPCDQCNSATGYTEKCRWYKDDCLFMDKHCCCFKEGDKLPGDCKHNRGRNSEKGEGKKTKKGEEAQCGFAEDGSWLGGKCFPCNKCKGKDEYSIKCRWYKDQCEHLEKHCCCFPKRDDITIPDQCKLNRGRRNWM